MTLGTKLQNLRKQSGMSQETLAGQLGVSRQAVSRWELDASLPETENIIKLAKLFDVSFDYLLNDDITENIMQTLPKHTGRNIYIDNITEFLKKYGYWCGYILSAVSAYCFAGYTITFLSLTRVISPSGEMAVLFGGIAIGNAMFGILIMYMLLSFGGIIGGLWLAEYLKKKTEKYRIASTEEADRR